MAHIKDLIVNGNSRTVGTAYATKFEGPLNGNASSATKATQDSNGNTITSTYATASSLSSHTGNKSNPHGVTKAQVGLGSVANIDQSKAIKSITRSGTTFTATALDGTTTTFTQQDNNTTYGKATSSADGLMSAADKAKLDGVASGANKYTHPGYTAHAAGLYKVTVDSQGHVSGATAVTKADITALGIPGQDTNTTYTLAGLGGVAKSGDTMSGNLSFSAIGDTEKSAGLSWSGSTDGAAIYYQTTASDQGNLVLNMTDDANTTIRFDWSGSNKAYIDASGVYHGTATYANSAGSANSVAWNNVSGKPSSYTPSSHTHTIAQVTNLQSSLDGKAAKSHTHAISDVTNLQNTINTINSNKADLSYVNNKISDMNYSRVALGGGNTANYPYHRFLSIQNVAKSYTDITGIYLIDKKFDGGPYGIVKVTLRTNDTASSYNISAKWLVRSSSQNPADIVFGSYIHDGKLDIDVFIKCGQWPRTSIYNVLGLSGWTMINSSEVDDTTTSDRKTSTECYSSLADAGSKIHSAAYSSTGTATDDGVVLKATQADTADNANKFNGYAGDFGTNNTNDTWVPVITSGKMQHRVIPADYNNAPSTLSVNHANSAKLIDGLKAGSSNTWGNQTGTNVVSWDTASGGSIQVRDNNPAARQCSILVDGTVYVNEGRNAVISTADIGNQSVNYATTAGSANSVAWGNVSGKPSTYYTHPSYTAHSAGLYKVTVDGTGHVSAVSNVTKADITALGIPGQDTNTTYAKATSSADGLMSAADKAKLDGVASGANKYTHPGYTAHGAGLYKVTVDSQGHVSGATAVTKADITALGIPGQDTNTTYGIATSTTAGLVKSGGNVTVNTDGTMSVSYASSAGSANAVAWANVNGKPELAYVSGASDLPSSYTGGDVWKAPS